MKDIDIILLCCTIIAVNSEMIALVAVSLWMQSEAGKDLRRRTRRLFWKVVDRKNKRGNY